MADTPGPAAPGGGQAPVARSTDRSIFRSAALRSYRQSQDRIVFPGFATPRALTYLWGLAAFFMILGAIVASRLLVPAG